MALDNLLGRLRQIAATIGAALEVDDNAPPRTRNQPRAPSRQAGGSQPSPNNDARRTQDTAAAADQPADATAPTDAPADEAAVDDEGESAPAANTDEGGTASPSNQAESNGGEPAVTDGGGDNNASANDISDLEYEIGELETDLESTQSTLRTIESEQSELQDEVEEIHDQMRELLSIYDEVTAEQNPFAGPQEMPTDPANQPDQNGAPQPPATDEDDQSGEDGLTFDDIKESRTQGAAQDDAPEAQQSSQQSAGGGPQTDKTGFTHGRFVDGESAVVDTPPTTYAGELIAFEWMSMLVERAGVVGAMQAIDQYESLGWISEPVKRYFEVMLSATDLEPDADPKPLDAIETDTHRESYKHVLQLQTVQTSPETQSPENSGVADANPR